MKFCLTVVVFGLLACAGGSHGFCRDTQEEALSLQALAEVLLILDTNQDAAGIRDKTISFYEGLQELDADRRARNGPHVRELFPPLEFARREAAGYVAQMQREGLQEILAALQSPPVKRFLDLAECTNPTTWNGRCIRPGPESA